jgi:hypothetical protein
MIIAAALIEGLAFLALVICLLALMNFGMPKQENLQANKAETAQTAQSK